MLFDNLSFIVSVKKDDDLYRSDSDESLRRFLASQQQLHEQPAQSTISLNHLSYNADPFRRLSNPDIYPGARRYSTSFSREDILSNDQLDQIKFDPRYRDYRSASSLTTINNNLRSRSNSLCSVGSGGGSTANPYRRRSTHSPMHNMLPVALAPTKRWDTTPAIFIEEYKEPPVRSEPKSESHHSRETMFSSNESMLPLSETDMKSIGDFSEIPFIDDDSNESAPCRLCDDVDDDNESAKKSSIIKNGNGERRDSCRKTVSFDVIAGAAEKKEHSHMFHSNGKCFPQSTTSSSHPNLLYKPNQYHPTLTNSYIHNNLNLTTSPRPPADVRRSKSGIYDSNNTTRCNTTIKCNSNSSSVPKQRPISDKFQFIKPIRDDHCKLSVKLKQLKIEGSTQNMKDNPKSKLNYKIKWDDNVKSKHVCQGKVKALTTYFNTLPYMADDCHCTSFHQSTPNLSNNLEKMSKHEEQKVLEQLKEWSEFGLDTPKKEKVCNFLEHDNSNPMLNLNNEDYEECKYYQEVLGKLDKADIRKQKNFHHSHGNISDYQYHPYHCLPDCLYLPIPQKYCNNMIQVSPSINRHHSNSELTLHHIKKLLPSSEKHRCRSPCYNIKNKTKNKSTSVPLTDFAI